MIHVNLLPDELRKIERVRKVKMNVAILAGGAVGAAVVVLAIVLAMIGRQVRALTEVKNRLRAITPQREEAEGLIRNKQQLQKELEALEGFSTGRLSWGRKLNALSDAMPDELFLVKVQFSSRPAAMLTVNGEAVSERGNEKVVEFIENLRGDPVFIGAFPHVNYGIESLDRRRKSFEIKCTPSKEKEKK